MERMARFTKMVAAFLVLLCIQASAFTASAEEPDVDHCAEWTFTTPSTYLSGEFVNVSTDLSPAFFNLDTSDTVQVPSAAITTTSAPTTLWGSSLPSSIVVDYFSVLKTEDDPSTPADESDSWMMSQQYYDLTFNVLEGFYFEAEIQGYAYHAVPSNPPETQVVLEPFTLTIRGWLPYGSSTYTEAPFSYCSIGVSGQCEDDCYSEYESCCDSCSTPSCYDQCMQEYATCLRECDE